MAITACSQLECLVKAGAVLVDSMTDSFSSFFGAWPDQCFWICEGVIKYRGSFKDASVNGGGFRSDAFSTQLEKELNMYFDSK
mmetsp:Transcript_22749/g.21981  ORF Transcript_22749/g.21981 Transcript_22749/m.21981 type:complete len:83 (+) Transcript_22749:841-1089(+)